MNRKAILIYTTIKMHNDVRKAAFKNNLSMSQFVQNIISEHLESQKQKYKKY